MEQEAVVNKVTTTLQCFQSQMSQMLCKAHKVKAIYHSHKLIPKQQIERTRNVCSILAFDESIHTGQLEKQNQKLNQSSENWDRTNINK